MTHNFEPKTLTILDPRTFDGDPFTVAQRAAEQVEAIVLLAAEQVATAQIMARNSYMEAILQAGDELEVSSWENSPYARKWEAVQAELQQTAERLKRLGQAAGFDPKHPPKAE